MGEITRMLPLASGEEKDELIVEKTKLQREMQTFGTSDLSGKSRS
jgi:hypothetical protein